MIAPSGATDGARGAAARSANPWRSFWMAGFEGSDHRNAAGTALDMVALTGHAASLDGDFRRLAQHGLRVARESIGWRLAEPGGRRVPGAGAAARFDLRRAVATAHAAREHGVQLTWTLMHYGMPEDVDVLDDSFVERFAEFAAHVARTLAPLHEGAPPVYTPINEISFLAWALCETSMMMPYVGDRADPRWRGMPDGYEVKRRLVRAALAAMREMRREDARCRFMHTDPLVHVVAPRSAAPALAAEAARFREFQWQAWDLLAGHVEPELGGGDDALDIVGVNYYPSGQWEFASGATLAWPAGDARRLALRTLLAEAHGRYGRPIVVAETGHTGDDRAAWLAEVAAEVDAACDAGARVDGICLYPVVDRPDWNDLGEWHRCGLWDGAATPGTAPAVDPRAGCTTRVPADAPLRELATLQSRRAGRPATGSRPQASRHREAVAPRDRVNIKESEEMRNMRKTIVVLSHLRWDFVYQRPQHLLSRLARDFDVVFVEEPVRGGAGGDGGDRLDVRAAAPGVTVLRPVTDGAEPGFADAQMRRLEPLVTAHLAAHGVERPVLWLYTPMAIAALDWMRPAAVVYDCMDELSAFLGAPPELVERERALLARADLVTTGGPSLHESKRRVRADALCLPSSVDAAHFAPRPSGADAALRARADALQVGFGTGPRLGYFGVVDERMDLGLVAHVARARPHWQLAMVGPVVKIDPARLPQAANLHWLGQQPYELLPHLLATWSVGLLPFALNDSTRFISPTKTLEYMAGGRPAVSTAIRDVATLYGNAVVIARDADEFVNGCERVLDEDPSARAQRARTMATLVESSSWERTAETIRGALMHRLAATARDGVAVG